MNKSNHNTIAAGQSDPGLPGPGRNRVYLDFYHLRESPFSITPDPEFLFFSNTHKNVIDKVLYGINNRMGFILLIGEVGTGKTTICRSILDRLEGYYEMVYIINPSGSGRELIAGVLDDLGIEYLPDSPKKVLIDHLNLFLLSEADNKPLVIIIDDAQTMRVDALEDLRLLSNLETDKEKLLQMILVGQPELLELLGRTEMRQLSQRVAISCRLEYLTKEEIDGYIARRLFIAGDSGYIRFTRKGINRIAASSKGVPRLINRICDYALTSGYIADEFVIGPRHVTKALKELGDLNVGKGSAGVVKTDRKHIVRRIMPVFASALMVAAAILLFAHLIDFNTLEKEWGYKSPANPEPGQTSVEKTNSAQKTSGAIPQAPPEEVIFPGDPVRHKTPLSENSDHYPFILLLGSYRTIFNTLNGVSSFNRQGNEVHWNRVDLGEGNVWYRLFTGPFRSKTEAKAYKKDNGLIESIIVSAPWSVLVGQADFPESFEEIRSRLTENQYDFYYENRQDGSCRLLVGAFTTREGAEEMAQEMSQFDLEARAIAR